MQIACINGAAATSLALAAHSDQDPACVPRAVEQGINFLFFYGLGQRAFIEAIKPIARTQRDQILIATGSGARSRSGLQAARRKILAALGTEIIDIFFAEYIHPGDQPETIFGNGGVLDELQRWKANGWIRYVGASVHDRKLAKQLARDGRVEVLMHRFNMAHRKAADEVFPAALRAQTPVVAFTATRWGTLLQSHPEWPDRPPAAADCYRYCLRQPAVKHVLTAPKTISELEQNLSVLALPPMDEPSCRRWEQFGDIVYAREGQGHAFESKWP